MTTGDQAEHGWKWWLRYVIVPLVGSGGLVAIVVALLTQSAPMPQGADKQAPPAKVSQTLSATAVAETKACDKALALAPVPMCDSWQVATESRVAAGNLMRFRFVEQRFPIFQFEIGAFVADERKTRRYNGVAWFNDGLRVNVHLLQHRWATTSESAVDYEGFTIRIDPGTFPDQPYAISYNGYFDRTTKEFVLKDSTVTLRDEVTRQGAQSVLGITPAARFVRMK